MEKLNWAAASGKLWLRISSNPIICVRFCLMRMRSWLIGVPAIVKQRTRAKKSLPSPKRRNLRIEKQKNSQVNCEGGCILDKMIAARKAEKK